MILKGDLGRRPSQGRVSQELSMLIRNWYDFRFCFVRALTRALYGIDPVVVCELRDVTLSFFGRCCELDVNHYFFIYVWTTFTDFSSKRPTLSYQRLQTVQPLTDSELYDKIRRTVANKHELQVLESFLIFNKYIFVPFPVSLKTYYSRT